jgi:hypothetical protein
LRPPSVERANIEEGGSSTKKLFHDHAVRVRADSECVVGVVFEKKDVLSGRIKAALWALEIEYRFED